LTQEHDNTVIGIVVPTMGTRPQFLAACIDSIRRGGDAHICLVGPPSVEHIPLRAKCDSFIVDNGKGLAAAINAGIASLPEQISFVNWLGDDDLVSPQSLSKLQALLMEHRDVVVAYGHCHYINTAGETLFTVRAARWAETLLRCGPQLISQPAMLFRRDTFQLVGGLDQGLGWAFDLDLLLKLRRHGRFKSIPEVVASYRWHEGALTVGSRNQSVSEASAVRVRHLPRIIRPFSRLWEPIVRRAVLQTGETLSRRYLSPA